MVKKLELLLLFSLLNTALSAVVPEVIDVASFPQVDETVMENDNIPLATDQDNLGLPSILQQNQDLPKPTQPPNTINPQKVEAQNVEDRAEQLKLLDLIIGLKVVQRLNEINQMDTTARNAQVAALLGIGRPVTSASGSDLFGGNTLLTTLANNGITPIGTLVNNGLIPVGSLGVAPILTGNFLTLLQTLLANMQTVPHNLIAAVGPTGIPIGSSIGSNIINPIGVTGTGILGSNTLGGVKPVVLTPALINALAGLGVDLSAQAGGTITTGGTINVPGFIPSKPSIATLVQALVGGILSSNGRSFSDKPDEGDEKNEMQWMASIMVNGKMVSKGVLVSDQHVLTIASPLLNIYYKDIQVKLKEDCKDEPITTSIISIMANPEFNPQTKAHDLALLKLSKKITTQKSLSICLPPLVSDNIFKVNVPTWHSTTQTQLCKPRNIQLELMNEEHCSKSIDPSALLTNDKRCMTSKTVDEDICETVVIGTPVQHIRKDGAVELHGLISNLMLCKESDNIQFIRVQDHLPWLLDHIKDDNMCMNI